MPFEKTKASVANRSGEQEDLKEEDDPSAGAGQPGNESDGDDQEDADDGASAADNQNQQKAADDEQNSLDYWKKRAEKAERNEANYREGMLSAKAAERSLDGTRKATPPKKEVVVEHEEEEEDDTEEDEESKKNSSVDVGEEKVLSVLYKQNERAALKSVHNPRSQEFIPELMDDRNYYQIIGYLPRNIDRSNPASIVKALKIAVRNWKEDNDIKDEKPKDDQKAVKANLATVQNSSGGTAKAKPKQNTGRKIIKPTTRMGDWYSKK